MVRCVDKNYKDFDKCPFCGSFIDIRTEIIKHVRGFNYLYKCGCETSKLMGLDVCVIVDCGKSNTLNRKIDEEIASLKKRITELEKNRNIKKPEMIPPERRYYGNLSDLCEEYLTTLVETGRRNEKEYFFEIAMEIHYGSKIWEFMNGIK